MKILVIGGSYFLGRVFVSMFAKDFDITVVNRGTYSLKDWGVKEYHFDRHDEQKWKDMNDCFDVIVDFCAYEKNDIAIVIDNMKNQFQRYIFISTVDVYQRQTGLYKNEEHSLEYRLFDGEMGIYIAHKVLLEHELQECCQKYEKSYTSLRLGMIYGPYNYAPRESLLIQRIIEGKPLVHLTDATATFQMVYVKDVAKAIALMVKKENIDKAYNIVEPKEHTYDEMNQILLSQKKGHIIDMSIKKAIDDEYPLPFPLYKEEMELYDGTKILKEDFQYTDLKKGLKETYQAFEPVYQKQ